MSIRWVDTPRTLTHFEKPAATVVGVRQRTRARQRTGATRRRTVQHAADRRVQLGLHDPGRPHSQAVRTRQAAELECERRHRLEPDAGFPRATAGLRRAAQDGRGEPRQQSVQGVCAVGGDGRRPGHPVDAASTQLGDQPVPARRTGRIARRVAARFVRAVVQREAVRRLADVRRSAPRGSVQPLPAAQSGLHVSDLAQPQSCCSTRSSPTRAGI